MLIAIFALVTRPFGEINIVFLGQKAFGQKLFVVSLRLFELMRLVANFLVKGFFMKCPTKLCNSVRP